MGLIFVLCKIWVTVATCTLFLSVLKLTCWMLPRHICLSYLLLIFDWNNKCGLRVAILCPRSGVLWKSFEKFLQEIESGRGGFSRHLHTMTMIRFHYSANFPGISSSLLTSRARNLFSWTTHLGLQDTQHYSSLLWVCQPHRDLSYWYWEFYCLICTYATGRL